MSRLNWRELLEERNVPFIESGPNVRRGELNITCPFCGSGDPSKHMGLNLESGWWSCWRNRTEHSGKSPVRLLMRLLHVGHAEALQLAGLDASHVDPDGFSAMAQRLRAGKPIEHPTAAELLAMPAELRELEPAGPTRRYWDYLWDRWFDPSILAKDYGVMAGLDGFWKSRVIFPYIEHGELVTMTGRAIGKSDARYKDMPLRPKEGYDGALARIPAKETLFNHDCMLDGGKWLLLQEGPVDALKVDCYGAAYGIRSVALSTASISDEQLARLDHLAHNFDFVGIMMDMANPLHIVHSMRMKSQVSSVHRGTHIVEVPFGRKDGGELKPKEVKEFCQQLLNKRSQQ